MIIRKVSKEWFKASSVPFLQRIVSADSRVQQVLWILSLIIGLSVAIYQVSGLLLTYLSYSTSVQIKEVQGAPPFPDVTICHQNAEWTYRQCQENGSLAEYRAKVITVMQEFAKNSKEYKLLNDYLYRKPYSFFQNNQQCGVLKQTIFDKFIISCQLFTPLRTDSTWIKCVESSSVETDLILDPVFGYCATYHINTTAVGSLKVMLYLDDHDHLEPKHFDELHDDSAMGSHTGALITVHPTGSYPDMMFGSNSIPAAFDVRFLLHTDLNSVLDKPYGECLSEQEIEQLERTRQIGYTTSKHEFECYRLCGRKTILEECGCLDIWYPLTKYDNKDVQMCGYLDMENITNTLQRLSCAVTVIEELIDATNLNAKCPCISPCEKFTHTYTMKPNRWPNKLLHLSFYEKFIRNSTFASQFQVYEPLWQQWKMPNTTYSNRVKVQSRVSNLDLIERNFLQVRIQNYQTSYKHYSEKPLLTLETLFGSVGGLLGMWVGLEFVTAIEILDFVYQLFARKQSKRQSDGKENMALSGESNNLE